ncbi:NAD(P)/FAD-dependent oxidoreductase [Burkholderia sp. A1]|uniref:FAD-dependent oxidoreductase n=1 Tax=Burkholderia sp. A1 TaxID=148446 RepID=UPI000B2AA292|nr:NAD(P)/FAD-dependent oxidoreductase [Burkholderia sp. A1]
MHRRDILKMSGAALASTLVSQLESRPAQAQGVPVIERDVCVIGGGSAGTYIATRLHDAGKSVTLLERKDHLGGHAETHIDPGTGTPINVGVLYFEQTPVVLDYFKRLDVESIVNQPGAGNNTALSIDLRTGLPLSNATPPSQADIGRALATYQQILATTYPYIDAGFQLPDPVPAELLEPFADFATKYGLQALVPTIFQYNQGAGDLLRSPTLYVIKLFGRGVVDAILGNGFLSIKGGTAQLYDKAARYLGNSVVLNARLRLIQRGDSRIRVMADTPTGSLTILCRKLVWSAPPTLGNLADVDLDRREASVFGRLQSRCYAVGLARISGLPQGISIVNRAPDRPYNLPPLPCLYTLIPILPGLYLVLFGAESPQPVDLIKTQIRLQVESLAQAGTYPVHFDGFEVLSNHTPFQLGVSAPEIAAGFYTRMNALQGYRNTYYNSAAFQTNDSSLIWQFTDALLPRILGALG